MNKFSNQKILIISIKIPIISNSSRFNHKILKTSISNQNFNYV